MLTHLLLMAQLAAFPGAQGGGATSVGGRGGQVIEVTTLNDSGAGSLRACINTSGPRTCIFRIGGQIVNLSRLEVNNPYLTIAAQTAPGGGITIGGANMSGEALFVNTHDVIVRYMTCNGDNPNTPTGPDTGTVCFETTSGSHDNIWDHISLRWWGNKGFITYSNDTGACCANVVRNLTLQNALVYEPNTTHPVGPGTDAAAWPNEAINQDFHHILFVNIGHRIPMVATSAIRVASSITFNWNYFAVALGGSSIDLLNNQWIAGNLNVGNSNPHPVQAWPGQGGNCTAGPACDLPGTPSVYMKGNTGPQGTDYQLTAEECCPDSEGKPETATPIRQAWQRSQPLPTETFPITSDIVNVATVGNSQGLDCSGNWFARRDSQDQRIIAQFNAHGPGNTFTGQFQQPAIAAGTPCPEDIDKLPIAYKKLHGLPIGTNVANVVASNGYTNFENYINGSTGVTPPPPVTNPSPNGTSITTGSGGSIVDAANNTWTFGAQVPVSSNGDCAPASCGNLIVKNGQSLAGTAATLLLWYNSLIYQENAAGGWWSYNGSGFTKVPGDPRPPVTPVSVAVTCVPNTIVYPATSACTALVTGSSNTAVTWSAVGGTMTGAVFTPAPGTSLDTVVATSVADPTKSGSATITVSQPPPPQTNPTVTFSISVAGGGTTTITCTWSGTLNAYSCK
jgi:pectate lyase